MDETVPDNLTASLTVFKGDDTVSRRHHHAAAETDSIQWTLSLGFCVLHAIIVRHLRIHLPRSSVPDEIKLKIKPAVQAPQSRFIDLSEDNFDVTVRRVYAQSVIRQRLSPENVLIPLVVFISEQASVRNSGSTNPSGLRRATIGRVRLATEEIVAAIQANPPSLPDRAVIGEIATNIWSRTRARAVNPEPVEQLPASNTFRQAMRLDYLRSSLENQDADEFAQIVLRVNRTELVTVEVNIASLRSALGLPPYPLFGNDIFHSDEPVPAVVGQDLNDVDHVLSDDEN